MTWTSRGVRLAVAVIASLTCAQAAWAHPGHPFSDSHPLLSGAMHPLLGLDHLLAMLASGLLAVRMSTGRHRTGKGLAPLWLIPVSFVGLMLLGGVLASLNVPFPLAEWGITLSVIVLGLAVALIPRIPLAVGVALVGLFAICHGFAHVAEAGGSTLLPYMTGFTLVTLGLHAAAISGGLLALQWGRPRWVRLAGAGIAACFALLMFVG